MALAIYSVEVPEDTSVVVFVNGMTARTWAGWWYIWRNPFRFIRAVRSAPGCLTAKNCFVSPRELLLISYWESHEALDAFFKAKNHREMMKRLYRDERDFDLYNETYLPRLPGRYVNAPNGLAHIFEKVGYRELG
jgi:hypothetical protein